MMNNKEPVVDPNFTPNTNQQNDNEKEKVNRIYINLNEQKLEVNLEDNSTASTLIKNTAIRAFDEYFYESFDTSYSYSKNSIGRTNI